MMKHASRSLFLDRCIRRLPSVSQILSCITPKRAVNDQTIEAGTMPVSHLSAFKKLSGKLVRDGDAAKVILQQNHPYLNAALLICKPADAETVKGLADLFTMIAADATKNPNQKRIALENVRELRLTHSVLCIYNHNASDRADLPKVIRPNGDNMAAYHSGDIHND
jgi:hypothetical protein